MKAIALAATVFLLLTHPTVFATDCSPLFLAHQSIAGSKVVEAPERVISRETFKSRERATLARDNPIFERISIYSSRTTNGVQQEEHATFQVFSEATPIESSLTIVTPNYATFPADFSSTPVLLTDTFEDRKTKRVFIVYVTPEGNKFRLTWGAETQYDIEKNDSSIRKYIVKRDEKLNLRKAMVSITYAGSIKSYSGQLIVPDDAASTNAVILEVKIFPSKAVAFLSTGQVLEYTMRLTSDLRVNFENPEPKSLSPEELRTHYGAQLQR